MTITRSIRIGCAAVLAILATEAGAQSNIFDITVAKHTATATDGAAAANYTGGTTLLQTDNMVCMDVACCVVLNKSGATGNFGMAADGLDVITSQMELDAVFAVATHHTKVVTSASNCCGVAGSILGCAKTTARNIVMVEGAPADVWAHEFGHTKGLAHNNTCAQLIMHATNLNTNAVTTAECTSFRANPDRMGPACGVVAVTVSGFEITAGAGGVELAWRLGGGAPAELAAVRVQRADASDGPWVDLGSLVPQVSMSFADGDVGTDRSYWYRLVLQSPGDGDVFVGPLRIDVPTAGQVRTALATPFQHRAGGPVEFRFSIGAAQAVRLEVFTVSGKRVRSLDQGVLETGSYVRTWDRTDESGVRLGRGVYLVRLAGAEGVAAKKLVLARD